MKRLIILSAFLFSFSGLIYSQTAKTILHGGITRDYIEYVPAIYNGTEPRPLLICLHGLGDDMTNFTSIGMHQVADTANFIVITPQALMAYYMTYQIGTAWNSGASYSGIVLNQTVDDKGFIRALIDTTSILYNIDTNRIYVTGFSMGGFMCHRLACEMNDVFAAIASVSGTLGNTITFSPTTPIPVCHFHGTADGTVSYTGNQYGNDAEEIVELWKDYNNCDSLPLVDSLPDIVSDGLRFVKQTWANGDEGSEVVFYKVLNGDHYWYYYPNNDITYTIEIWNFLRQFPKTGSSGNIELNKHDFFVYPNPATDIVFIKHPGTRSGDVISVQSITGECVKSFFPDGEMTSFSVSDLSSGIYIISYTNSEFSLRRKIFIE